MRLFPCLTLAALGTTVLAGTSQAALVGTSITGSITFGGGTNFFDPANGFVPSTFLNTAGPTVTVAEPAIEFDFADSADGISVNVTDSQVLLQDQTLNESTFVTAYRIKLTDSAFSGQNAVVVADTFTGISAGITGTTLTINVPATSRPLNTLSLALYRITVPEPTSAVAVAAVGAMAVLRRRRTVAL